MERSSIWQPTIGCELEAGVVSSKACNSALLKPEVDTLALLGGGVASQKVPFLGVTSDMMRSSIEFVTGVCGNEEVLGEHFAWLLERVPKDHVPVFKSCPFGAGNVPLANKSRVSAVVQALTREHPEGWRGVDTVAPWCSTQYHVGIPGIEKPESVLLLNVLNESGPYMRQRVIERYQVEGDAGHLMIWHGWANPDRLPKPILFTDVHHLGHYVSRIPKLVTRKDGEWVMAPHGINSDLSDSESVGTIWWIVRPRMFETGETLEVRCFPSLPPEQAVPLGGELLRLVQYFWSFVASYPLPGNAADVNYINRLYQYLHKRSYLIPPSRPTHEHWWELFRL